MAQNSRGAKDKELFGVKVVRVHIVESTIATHAKAVSSLFLHVLLLDLFVAV